MLWTVMKMNGGLRRSNNPTAIVAVGEEIFSFGGSRNYFNDYSPMEVHVLQTADYKWRVLKTPDPSSSQYDMIPYQLSYHTVVVYKEMCYTWGCSVGSSDSLFCFDTKTRLWSKPDVHGVKPARAVLFAHSACVINDSIYFFGAFYKTFCQLSYEVYKIDLKSMTWSVVTTKGIPPTIRNSYSATVIKNQIYIIGGCEHGGPIEDDIYCDQIVVLDTETSTWIRPQVNKGYRPVSRRGHSAFCHDDQLYIFGGYNKHSYQEYFNDVVRYDPELCSWFMMKPRGNGPCPRYLQSCCSIKDRVFLFGGKTLQGNILDFHVLEFAPSLKTMAILKVLEYKLDQARLPETVKSDIKCMTSPPEEKSQISLQLIALLDE